MAPVNTPPGSNRGRPAHFVIAGQGQLPMPQDDHLGMARIVTRAGPTLPLNAREGDILQCRDGEWVAVSPLEALQVLRDPRLREGEIAHAEYFDGFTVVARPRGEKDEPIPVPETPTPANPWRPTAWARLLADDDSVY